MKPGRRSRNRHTKCGKPDRPANRRLSARAEFFSSTRHLLRRSRQMPEQMTSTFRPPVRTGKKWSGRPGRRSAGVDLSAGQNAGRRAEGGHNLILKRRYAGNDSYRYEDQQEPIFREILPIVIRPHRANELLHSSSFLSLSLVSALASFSRGATRRLGKGSRN